MPDSKEEKKKLQILISCAFLISFPLMIFFSPVYFPMIQEYFNRLDFDSEVWKKPSSSSYEGPVRIRMVDDLLWEYDLVGMASEEVTILLGPTDNLGYFDSYDFVYWLGPERSFFGVDSEWLVILLDDNGKVSRHKIVTD